MSTSTETTSTETTLTATNSPQLSGRANEGAATKELPPQSVLIPRWVIYFQAALLGLVATTFFIFGMMVGSLTSSGSTVSEETFGCAVSGTIQFTSAGGVVGDRGAVVFLLPKNGRPGERAPGNLVSPKGFEPLNNPGIESVHQLGGAVVRADADGNFNVVIDASDQGIEYYLLVVSNKVAEPNRPELTKLQVATIGTFYLPVDRVIDDRSIYWSQLTANVQRLELPNVVFEER